MNWVLEVSNTGFNENIIELDHKAALQIFSTNLRMDTSRYRFLRIRLTGKVTSGDYYLTVSAIEFFGFLYE